MALSWYTEDLPIVYKELQTNEAGLRVEEATRRLKEDGPNTLPETKPDGYPIIFLRQFQSPLIYILLAANGHPDAHEYVREMTLKSQLERKPLIELVRKDKPIQPYLKKLSRKQLEIINNPEKYTGIASRKAEMVCEKWKKEFKI